MLEAFWLHSRSGKPKLRIGLMLDSFDLMASFAVILDHIEKCNFAENCLVILNGEHQAGSVAPADSGPQRSRVRRVLRVLRNEKLRRGLGYRFYTRLDEWLHPLPNDPLRLVDCRARLAGVETLTVYPLAKGFVHRFKEEDLKLIQSKNLDVILRFGFNIIRGEILQSARYGVWSYHHGDNDYYRGGPALFWEIIEGHPHSGVMLQVLNDELDAGKVLCKARRATRPGIWHSLNRLEPYWVGSFFVIQKLFQLHEYGWDYVETLCVPNRSYEGKRTIYRTPTNAEVLKHVAPRLLKKIVTRPIRPRTSSHWRFAVRNAPQRMLEPGQTPDLREFRWIESPRGKFFADPFLFSREGQTWVFFENYDCASGRGIISCAALLPDGSLSQISTALERPYHLSFPFVFEDGGRVFMIPETGANKSVELYRCISFPAQWTLEKTLYSGTGAVDCVMTKRAGRYWFFVSLVDPPGTGPQLFLFWSDSLQGPWTIHRASPISLDVRYARNAGAIFEHNGRLIRPSQDGSRDYGYAAHWNEVVTLSETEYEERPVLTILPDWLPGLVGTHTYNRSGTFEVVDGKFRSL